MSVFSGKKEANLVGRPLDERLYLSVNMQIADENTYNPYIFAIPDEKIGEALLHFPDIVHNVKQASIEESVNSPFYQGVYFQTAAVIINGSVFDLGFITADTAYSFELFVTHSTKLTVETIGIVATSSGVTVTNMNVGDIWYPYEEKTVELLATESGPGVVQTQFFIKFEEDPVTYLLSVGGARAGRFFLFEPNWAESVTVERRFLTSIFTSQNMTETRKVLRDKPLRSLQVSLTYPNKFGAGKAWTQMRDMAKEITAHPWYPDRSTMTQTPLAGRIFCDVSFRRFSAGAFAFLSRKAGQTGQIYTEVVQISSVLSDGFLTVDPIVNAYNVGDAAYPAFVCYAALEGNTAQSMTDSIGTYTLIADEVYANTILDNENASYSPTIRKSLPIFDLTTTFSELPEVGVLMGGDLIDSGRGALQSTRGMPYVTQTVTSLCLTKEECWNAIGFFNYLKGRGKPFWVKSELNWMSITGTSGNAEFSIDNLNTLEDMDYLIYCWVVDSNGDFDILAVTDRQPSAAGITITLESNSLSDISEVRQAHAVRLAEDLITEEYLTDDKMLTTFTVQELQGI